MVRRALIVDDEPSVRFVLRRALRDTGWLVDEVDDGTQVEERLQSEHFDLLVLDLFMPGMNGYEVLRRVRRHVPGFLPEWKTDAAVRIVVLSAATAEGLTFAQRLGADACFSKPFDVTELLAAVKRD